MLSEDQLRKCLFCAVEEKQARERGKPPGLSRWNDELINALYGELAALSRTRQPDNTTQSDSAYDADDWLTAREVAAMTQRNARWVQRHAPKLGGVIFGRQYRFPRSAVVEHIKGQAA